MKRLWAVSVALALLGPADATEPGPARLVWSGSSVTLLGGPSRDGKYFSYADPHTGDDLWTPGSLAFFLQGV